MSEQTFDKLVSLLRDQLAADVKQPRRSARGNGPTTAEMAAGAGLRFLGGEFSKSISWHFGVSPKSPPRMIGKFLHAAGSNPALGIKAPSTAGA